MPVEPDDIRDISIFPEETPPPGHSVPTEAINTDDGRSFSPGNDEWPDDDIEQAYLQALQAVEEVEHRVNADTGINIAEDQPEDPDLLLEPLATDGTATNGDTAGESPQDAVLPNVTPRQIIEAAIFVGGTSLTLKRISMLLRNEFDHDFIEQTIDSLNMQYAEEQRPYEITFGEGGYRLALCSEFERLRSRAYGFGPKEVKLSQDALEVLALVAYRQPLTAAEVEKAGKSKPGSILRLLVRRQLIEIERTGKKRDDVIYRTTPRFLELFDLKDLEELPQSDDDLEFK